MNALLFCCTAASRVAIGLMALLLLAGSAAAQVTLEETLWNFTNRPHRYGMNLVSVHFNNPTNKPFDGVVELRKSLNLGSYLDATFVEPLYVAENSDRWVQFYVYVGQGYESWSLTVNGRGRSDITPTQTANMANSEEWMSKAVVALVDGQRLGGLGGNVKRFPDMLFPAAVGGTDSLGMLLLDHAPRWDEPRKQAFMDWLAAGGTAVVLHGVSGDFPQFAAGLTVLNAPLDIAQHYAGTIVRLPKALGDVDQPLLDLLLHNPQAAFATTPAPAAATETKADPNTQVANAMNQYQMGQDIDDALLVSLKRMTNPDHNWPLIYLLGCAYVLAVFPGAWLVGRKPKLVWVMYGGLLLLVVGMSAAFAMIGRRGYGEATVVHSIALARPVDDNRWDVSQWSDLFVTSGGQYRIQHRAETAVYATGQMNEAVEGEIRNGAQAQFVVNMPPFSSRGLIHRASLQAPTPKPQVDSVVRDANGRITSAKIAFDTGWSQIDSTSIAYAMVGDRMLMGTGDKTSLSLRETNLGTMQERVSQNLPQTKSQEFRKIAETLLIGSLQRSTPQRSVSISAIPKDRLRLVVLAPALEEFRIQGATFPLQNGEALYQFDLPLDSAVDATPQPAEPTI